MEMSRNTHNTEGKLAKSNDTGLICSQSLVGLRSDKRWNKYTKIGKSHWVLPGFKALLSTGSNLIMLGRQHLEWKKHPLPKKHNILDCFDNMIDLK